MPAASEPFTWKLFAGAERICHHCRRKLRVIDVREHRVVYPGGRLEFWCDDCFRERTRPETPTADPRP